MQQQNNLIYLIDVYIYIVCTFAAFLYFINYVPNPALFTNMKVNNDKKACNSDLLRIKNGNFRTIAIYAKENANKKNKTQHYIILKCCRDVRERGEE